MYDKQRPLGKDKAEAHEKFQKMCETDVWVEHTFGQTWDEGACFPENKN